MGVNLLQGTHALNFQSLITFVGKAGGNQIHMASSAPRHRHDNLSQPPVHRSQREQEKEKKKKAATK